MPLTHLIIVDANDDTNFKYTDFASGQDADPCPVNAGDRVSWIVFSVKKMIGYRIDFRKNGTPFKTKSVIVPEGGISPAETVTSHANSGKLYSVTLADLRTDDPQVVPYDPLLPDALKKKLLTTTQKISIDVSAAQVTTLSHNPAPYTPGTIVLWHYAGAAAAPFTIDFSASGRSPFVDPSSSSGPLYEAHGNTAAQIVRPLNAGENASFTYTAQVSGAQAITGTLTIT